MPVAEKSVPSKWPGGIGSATRSTRCLVSFPATFVEGPRTRVLELMVYRADTKPFSARQALYLVFNGVSREMDKPTKVRLLFAIKGKWLRLFKKHHLRHTLTTILVARGHLVSCYSTAGGDVLSKDNHFSLNKVSHDLTQSFAFNHLIFLNIKVSFDLFICTW